MKTLSLTLSVFLVGCVSVPTPDPDYAPVMPVPYAPATVNGAIYQHGNNLVLYEDIKARRVGDTLTIVLAEQTNANTKAATSTKKENDIDLPAPTVMGRTATHSKTPLTNTFETEQDFSGKGDSSRSNSLSGSITVTVVETLTNGNLKVRGEKLINLNQGSEYIRIKGIVRPRDIAPDNTVLSTKVAHAQISYGGTGALADANRHGWLSRFFLKLWPF